MIPGLLFERRAEPFLQFRSQRLVLNLFDSMFNQIRGLVYQTSVIRTNLLSFYDSPGSDVSFVLG